MADDIDRAQEINERFQAAALARTCRGDRRSPVIEQGDRPVAPTHEYRTRPSALVCVDCDEPIPDKRRAAVPGCNRCVDCQSLLENWRPL